MFLVGFAHCIRHKKSANNKSCLRILKRMKFNFSCLSNYLPSGCETGASTTPLIEIVFDGSFTAFDVIVTVLLNEPVLIVSYFTVITPFFPGAIGSFVHSGIVQPQEPTQLEIINGAFPVFLNSKVHVPLEPFGIVP